MNDEELAQSKKLFKTKKIRLSQKMDDKLNENILKILEKDEEIIKKYLERAIYTSNLSKEINEEIDKIYSSIRNIFTT